MDELTHIPLLNPSEIGVSVKNGIVTLTGNVDSYPQKVAAERAVLRLKDVHGVADDLIVALNNKNNKSDSEIAQAALYAVEWHSGLDPDKIKILVEDGVVTLSGTVDWDYQRKLAFKTVKNIVGIKNVINNIKLRQRPIPEQVKEKIKAAFHRNANINASAIHVELEGHKVVLTGTVKSWLEKVEAENTVWSLPGISEVENKLEYTGLFTPSEAL